MGRPLTLEEIRNRAKEHDVTYDLYRISGQRMRGNDPELLAIQRQGFESEATAWLKSMMPESMKYGKASRKERLERAEEFAKKAGVSLAELAQRSNLQHVLKT